jgi:HEAT repeat protein
MDRIDQLIKQLKDKDWRTRRNAALELGRTGHIKAVVPLLEALGDISTEVCTEAVDALVELGDSGLIVPLTAALKHEDFAVRQEIAGVLDILDWTPENNSQLAFYLAAKQQWRDLAPLGKDAVDALINVVKDEPMYYLEEAVEILGNIGDARAIEPLIDTLNSENPANREKAVDALVKIAKAGGPFEPLIDALKNTDGLIRKGAARVLDIVGWVPSSNSQSALFLAAKQEWGRLAALGKDAVDALINVVKDDSSFFRKGAMETLGEIGDARAVEPLMDAVKDGVPGALELAAQALVKIGEPAVEPLCHVLQDRGPSVRRTAVHALGEIGDTRAIEPLIQALEYSQKDIIAALVKIADPKHAQPFMEALKHKSFETRKALAKILDGIGWKPSNTQESALYLAALQKWDELFTLGDEARDILIPALDDEDANVRKNAARGLGKIGDTAAVEPLIHVLENDKDRLVRRNAAMALCNIGDSRAVEPLIAYIKRKGLFTRRKIIHRLGEIGDANVIPLLFAFMEERRLFTRGKLTRAITRIALRSSDTNPVVTALENGDDRIRGAAAKVLDNTGWKPANNKESALYLIAKKKWKPLLGVGKEAVDALIGIVNDKNKTVRLDAVKTLGKIGSPRAVEPLIKRLYYEYNPNWFTVVAALDRIKNAGKIEPFLNALKNEDATFRLKTTEVLSYVDWKPSNPQESALYLAAKQDWHKLSRAGARAVEPLVRLTTDNLPDIREHAVETLGKIGVPAAVEPLIQSLEDEDLNVRKKAVKALGRIGGPRAVDVLIETLKKTDTGIRREAVKALGHAGEIKAVEPLISALVDKDSDPDTRREAAEALGRIKEPRAATRLIALLEDNIPDVRKNAAVILGNMGDRRAVEPLTRTLHDEQSEVSEEAAAALGKIGDIRAVEPLHDKMRDKQPGWERAALALGEIGDTRAIDSLIAMEWKSKEAQWILNKMRNKIPYEDLDFLCEKCRCRANEFHSETSLSTYFRHISIYYYACRMCRSNSYLLSGIKIAVLLLDHGCEDTFVQKGESVIVNWFKSEELFDYTEIRIIDADDYEVEKLVMTLMNDMDDQRRKRLPKIPVYLSHQLKISQAKMNLLKDNFTIKTIKEGQPWKQ